MRTTFYENYISANLKSIRNGMIIGMLLYLSFGFLDIFLAPIHFFELQFIRLGVLLIQVACLTITYYDRFQRIATYVLITRTLATGFGIIVMVTVSSPEELSSKYYFVGLILIFIGIHAIYRIHFKWAVIVSIIIIILHNMLNDSRLSTEQIIMQNFFLSASAVLTLYSSFTNEKLLMKNYLYQVLIENEKFLLLKSEENLKKINISKNKFFSIIAHDLKAPIRSLKGYLYLMNNNSLSLQESNTILKKMTNSFENLSSLLENLLEWSIAQKGEIKIMIEHVNLPEIINENISLFLPIASEKSISLKWDSQKVVFAKADKNILRTILRNLISNAIKFTPQNGSISVDVYSDTIESSPYAIIEIKDSGIGISPEMLSKLFTINENVKRQGTCGELGTGLGLILCQEFSDLIQARIWASSTEGKGSTLFLALRTS